VSKILTKVTSQAVQKVGEKEWLKRWVFWRLRKTCRYSVDVT